MAKINLREYHREIEQLTTNGHTEEATAHCKHILNSFPKDVATYRLFGKAYLESQQYNEAADLFQRVLSVIPDDFVSQIGLSIAREAEKNLDEAIWHMEMAYECQPANSVLQDELRRLYQLRDGSLPLRIRLTRGALARTYIQGGLYPQAIAELRASLADDPNRVDREILLAKSYQLNGQNVEAAAQSAKILSKLPFCIEANLIFSTSFSGNSRSEEIEKCQKRLGMVNPYFQFCSRPEIGETEISDEAVMIERFYKDARWTASPLQSRFTSTMDTSQTANSSLYVNLKNESITPEPPLIVLQDLPAITSPPLNSTNMPEDASGNIPDWMRNAGWSKSTGEEENLKASGHIEEAVEAEIPGWLRNMAPQVEVLPSSDTFQGEVENIDNSPHEPLTGYDSIPQLANMESEALVGEPIFPVAHQDITDQTIEPPLVDEVTNSFIQDFSEDELVSETTDVDKVQQPIPVINNSQEIEDISQTTLDEVTNTPGSDLKHPGETQIISHITPTSEAGISSDIDISDFIGPIIISTDRSEEENPPVVLDGVTLLQPNIDLPQENDNSLVVDQPSFGDVKMVEPDISNQRNSFNANPSDNILPTQLDSDGMSLSYFSPEVYTPLDQSNGQFLENNSPDFYTHLPVLENVDTSQTTQENSISPGPIKPVSGEILTEQNGTDFQNDHVAGIIEKDFTDTDDIDLQLAREQIRSGNLSSAINRYKHLIVENKQLASVILDLAEAATSNPANIELWQTLGDAYAAENRLRDAMEAYTKAEKLLN